MSLWQAFRNGQETISFIPFEQAPRFTVEPYWKLTLQNKIKQASHDESCQYAILYFVPTARLLGNLVEKYLECSTIARATLSILLENFKSQVIVIQKSSTVCLD